MYCRNCGKEIANDNRFCPNCGSPVAKVGNDEKTIPYVNLSSPSNTSNTTSQFNDAQKPQKKFSGLSIASFICSLTVILSPLGFILAIIDFVKNKGKKHLFSILALIISSIFLFSFFIGVFDGLSGDSDEASTTSTTQQSSSQKPTVKATSKPTAEPTPNPTVVPSYNIGDKVVFDDIEVTINSITFSDHAGGFSKLAKADSGFCYCVIDIDVKNLTTTSLDLETDWPHSGKYSFELIHDGENQYLQTFYSYTDFFDGNSSIPAKGTLKNKKLNYLVPIEMKTDGLSIELNLTYNTIWRDGIVSWKLR